MLLETFQTIKKKNMTEYNAFSNTDIEDIEKRFIYFTLFLFITTNRRLPCDDVIKKSEENKQNKVV